MPSRKVVVTHAMRSPFGAFKGAFSSETPVSLGVEVVQALLKNAGLKPDSIEQVWFGQAKPDPRTPNIASIISYKSGINVRVPACTVNLGAGSGLVAVFQAARSILSGEINVALVGAVDCPSYFLNSGNDTPVEETIHGPEALWCPLLQEPWRKSIEHVASKFEIDREAMAGYARLSVERARKARVQGLQELLIAPIHIHSGDELSRTLRADEYLLNPTRERLENAGENKEEEYREEGLLPVNSISPLSDCAAAMVLMSGDEALKRGYKPLARFGQGRIFGADPRYSALGGVNAAREVCGIAGIMPSSFDIVEVGETFAVEALVTMKQLSLDKEKVNVHGGELAYGFAFGATSAAKAVALVHEISRKGYRKGLVTVSSESGMGVAATFYRFSEHGYLLFSLPEIKEEESKEFFRTRKAKRRR